MSIAFGIIFPCFPIFILYFSSFLSIDPFVLGKGSREAAKQTAWEKLQGKSVEKKAAANRAAVGYRQKNITEYQRKSLTFGQKSVIMKPVGKRSGSLCCHSFLREGQDTRNALKC